MIFIANKKSKNIKRKKEFQIDDNTREEYNLKSSYNTYDEFVSDYVEGFVSKMFNDGIVKVIETKTLQEWLSNPDKHIKDIHNLLNYYYISDGAIFQLYDLMYSLSDLNYSISSFENYKKDDENIGKINKIMKRKIKYKELTRDIINQLHSSGTIICTWLGSKSNPYLYVFDNLEYIFPSHRRHGELVGVIDLAWFDNMQEHERTIFFDNLSPIVTKEKYDLYEKNKDEQKYKYVELPTDKTTVLRTHTLSRNQRLGIPHGTQTLFDLQHKKKMKDLEIAIANKIIRAIALIKFKGKDDNDIKVPDTKRKKVFKEVKNALQKNQTDGGIACIGLPDFASFEFPELKNGEKTLDPEKYKAVNSDISSSMGISPVLTNGLEGNFASAKLNLEMLYRKIGVSLEQIESIYNKLLEWVIGNDDYYIEFNKDMPLSKKEKLDVLFKLHQEGFAVKPIIDLVDGVNYEDYISQSINEIEVLKLREKITPPQLSYTGSHKDSDGSSEKDSEENDNTIKAEENDRDNTPRANV